MGATAEGRTTRAGAPSEKDPEDRTMARALRVGIIGVSAEGGWARESHVPAVHNLAGLELAAVASSDQAKAKAAAKAFGAMERI